jgi:signal transduction histidine kinase
MLLITVVPITVLLLLVVFWSQKLHYEAMRAMVGDRDLRTVQAAAASIDRELRHLVSYIQILANEVEDEAALEGYLFENPSIVPVFEGLALYSSDGELLLSTDPAVDWQSFPSQIPSIFTGQDRNIDQPYIFHFSQNNDLVHSKILLSAQTIHQGYVLGISSMELLVGNAIGGLLDTDKITTLIVSRDMLNESPDLLYHSGPRNPVEDLLTHPGVSEVLNGESGMHYYEILEGEHVVAYTPIGNSGWGLVLEEEWEDIASPNLMTTQYVPLILVPVFLLSLFLIWFGANRIVKPLQKLEKQASGLAAGDFGSIQNSVGGIAEIQNLQAEMVQMANELQAAQANLHDYIGSITAGVENERRSIARELHDDTIQNLIALSQRIQLIAISSPETQRESLSELKELVHVAVLNVRRLIRGLRPIYLEEFGLVTALEMLVSESEKQDSLIISFNTAGTQRRLEPEVELSLYRMVQESLQNVVRHSQAQHAWIDVIYDENGLQIIIRDDGKGFYVPVNPTAFVKTGHFGLIGLQERAELINAVLKIQSNPGAGTTTTIQLVWA